jgi:peptide/nickel transport system permease protein
VLVSPEPLDEHSETGTELLPSEDGEELDEVGPRPKSRARGKGAIVLGVVWLVLAVVVVYVGLVTLGHVNAFIKAAVVLFGLFLAYLGINDILKALRGPDYDTMLWLCVTWLVVLGLAAVFADFLPLGEAFDPGKTLSEPGYARPDLFSKHPLGTNNFSLDLLARCIYGARVSLLTATFAVLIGLVIGGAIGMAAGYKRGKLDTVVGVLTDSILAFPALVLLIALATVVGRPENLGQAIVKTGGVLGLIAMPTIARLARANTLAYSEREFVLASRAMGARNRRVIWKELVPNVAPTLLSFALVLIAVLIIAEGSLAFLGLGLLPPQPSWGNMIAEGQDTKVLQQYPFIPLVPGAFMFLTVFSFNRIGERARQKLDRRDAKN